MSESFKFNILINEPLDFTEIQYLLKSHYLTLSNKYKQEFRVVNHDGYFEIYFSNKELSRFINKKNEVISSVVSSLVEYMSSINGRLFFIFSASSREFFDYDLPISVIDFSNFEFKKRKEILYRLI